MSLTTQGKTNWKFIGILVVLIIIVGGTLFCVKTKEASQKATVEELREFSGHIDELERVDILFQLEGIIKEEESWLCDYSFVDTTGGICIKNKIKNIDSYIDKSVIIEGYYYGYSLVADPQETFEIKKIKIIEENKTTDWQTYRNEEYGYEIKYPVDWEYREKEYPQETKEITGLITTTGLTPKNKVCNLGEERIYPIEIVVNSESLQQFLTEEESKLTKEFKESSAYKEMHKEVLINEIPTIEVKDLKGETVEFMIDRPGKNSYFSIDNFIPIMMSNECISSNEKDELWVIFNQILSTFRFLD